ncbi:MAG TPA: PAS domain S-box protein [Thermoanaerobaculia bacterium]|nr:PAS domain S-box protein [Thermoanaerobaculia bacterium]
MLEAELFDLLEHTSDAVFSLTESGEIVSWNKAAAALFGYSAREALGKSCFEILEGVGPLGTRFCHENCTIIECAVRKSNVPDFDLSVKTRNGARVWVNVSTIVFDNPRTGHRVVVHMARDITRRKEAEDLARRLVDVSRQLIASSEEAKALVPVSALSEQERQILRMFAEGQDADTIAHELDISRQTLRNHLHHINRKLGTHNRLEAVMHAMQRKLI